MCDDEPVRLPEVLTVKEVAERLRCGLSTVYEMCDKGLLKTFRLKPGSRKGIRVFSKSVADLMAAPAPEPVKAPEPEPRPRVKLGRRAGRHRLHLPSPFGSSPSPS